MVDMTLRALSGSFQSSGASDSFVKRVSSVSLAAMSKTHQVAGDAPFQLFDGFVAAL
jgi:hypothetical protein